MEPRLILPEYYQQKAVKHNRSYGTVANFILGGLYLSLGKKKAPLNTAKGDIKDAFCNRYETFVTGPKVIIILIISFLATVNNTAQND